MTQAFDAIIVAARTDGTIPGRDNSGPGEPSGRTHPCVRPGVRAAWSRRAKGSGRQVEGPTTTGANYIAGHGFLPCGHFRRGASALLKPRLISERAIPGLNHVDLVFVTRCGRLARSTRDRLKILVEIAYKGAGFRSLSETGLDTTTSHGRLMLTVRTRAYSSPHR
jgi:hypothetical protein